jgi:hypothetical protein
LSFQASKKSKKNFIDPAIFNHPRFGAVVAVAATESYLQHADPDGEVDIQAGLLEVGNIISKIRDANELEFEIHFVGHTQLRELSLDGLNNEIKMLVEDLPGPQMLNTINLVCTNDIFLEVLMGNIRNALVSFQTWMRKVDNCKVSFLNRRLNLLKGDYISNQQEISELESALTEHRENMLNKKIKHMKIFEHLHNEKPSPLFLSLVKNRSFDSLQNICDDNGSPFLQEEDRNKHIVGYYEKVYKSKSSRTDYNNCIENFLGPDIVGSNLVRDSLITDAERLLLNADLTVEELDKSINNANMKSAPGQDGFSNVLIRKCWNYLRLPLLNYANYCFVSGTLTENFRSALIKLIPKKGDSTLLKNWRPISLLSNMYKIISRAITARLSQVNNRICSRAQKGYNNRRYSQEVLINVCEAIAYCKHNNIRAGVLAVDMAKAFDTLEHKFIDQVYKFFGLGDNMISWLRLLGNQRQACIALNNDSCSSYFNLGTGRPQGDNLSPITFNFCEQILIFKLELDPLILGIPRQVIPQVTPVSPYTFESNRETAKNESLADDNTVICQIQEGTLFRIKDILNDFSGISGLECNYDKTVLLPIFEPNAEEMRVIESVGFRSVDKIKLLGCDITRNYDDLQGNFRTIKEKILNLIRFWERFKLSLPGRISIAKTFMVSQLNYLGCVFRPDPDLLSEIQSMLDCFIKKNLNISRERICRPVSLGGLGFFNLSDFLSAQRCSWIFRAYRYTIDNWRYDLFSSAPGNNILLLRKSDIDIRTNPVLHEFVEDYEKFYSYFTAYKGNFQDSFVFENRNFTRTENNALLLDRNFFGAALYDNNKLLIRNLKFSDCYRNGEFKSLNDWREYGLNFTVNTWLRLRNAIFAAKNKYNALEQPVLSISDFTAGLKKGSKKIRKFFEHNRVNGLKLEELTVFKSFCRITNCNPGTQHLNIWVGGWNTFALQNDLRNFILLCRFNILHLNNRLHSFLADVDPRCTFCRINNQGTQEIETFKHCFLTCPVIRDILSSFCINLDITVTDTDDFLRFYWFGQYPYDNDNNDNDNTSVFCYNLLFDIVRYVIYKHRQRRHLPTYSVVRNHTLFLVNNICRASKRIHNMMCTINQLRFLTQALG